MWIVWIRKLRELSSRSCGDYEANLEADLEQEDENELVVEIAVQDSQVPEGFSLDTTFEEDSEEEEE